MNRFRYVGCDSQGARTRGVVWAREGADARAILDAKHIHLIALHLDNSTVSSLRGKSKSRLSVLRSLATQLAAGVPVRAALISAERAHGEREVAAGIREVQRMVAEGERLGDSLDRAGLVAPMTASLIRTGEASGALWESMQLAVTQLEREAEVHAKLKAALTYPAILVVTAGLSLGVIILVVLPQFAEIASDVGGRPPRLAVPLLMVAGAIRERSELAAVVAIAALVAICGVLVRPRARELLRERARKSRLLAPMTERWAAAQVCHELGTLLRAGMSPSRALPELIRTRDDDHVASALRDALARISNGERFGSALIESGSLPRSALPLLEVGEQTAQLSEMLHCAGADLDRELAGRMDAALTLLQPTIVLVFGGIIALVAGAVMQTLYSVRPSL